MVTWSEDSFNFLASLSPSLSWSKRKSEEEQNRRRREKLKEFIVSCIPPVNPLSLSLRVMLLIHTSVVRIVITVLVNKVRQAQGDEEPSVRAAVKTD